jgi:hypothetical protein
MLHEDVTVLSSIEHLASGIVSPQAMSDFISLNLSV